MGTTRHTPPRRRNLCAVGGGPSVSGAESSGRNTVSAFAVESSASATPSTRWAKGVHVRKESAG